MSSFLLAISIMAALAIILGAILGFASVRFRVHADPLVDQIDAILPQTQCGQCGFPGCRPYAKAIAESQADINKCPPGGEDGIRKLAELLGVDFKNFDDGQIQEKQKATAFIDENFCIGCTLCVKACPVDAILGSAKHMHTVIKNECTGCELCLEACPVDCIHMKKTQETLQTWRRMYPTIKIHLVNK